MYSMGIDIGGTKIKIGLFKDNRIMRVEEIKTPQAFIADAMIETIHNMTRTQHIERIGVASAGIVNFHQGMIMSAANLSQLENVPLQQELEKAFRVPVAIENDADCASLAEGEIGAANSASSYICVTIGTGIGGGIVHNHNLVHGAHGYGGEIGHMVVVPNGIVCGCGRKGCWESYASGNALERMIAADSNLAAKGYRPEDLFEQYSEEPSCKQIVDDFLEYLSIGIINLQYTFDPEMIVIGGGVIDSGEYWWDKLLEKVEADATIPVKLKQAQLKNDASMIGASLLVKK